MAIEPEKPSKAKRGRTAAEVRRSLNEASTAMVTGAQDLFESKRDLDVQAYTLRENRDVLAGRSTEKQIADAVLKYLVQKPDGEATLVEIKGAIPELVPLTKADWTQSLSRESEALWEQQIRNIVSHRATPGNYINQGLLSYKRSGTLKLTDAGKRHLQGAEGFEGFESSQGSQGLGMFRGGLSGILNRFSGSSS